MKIPLLVVHARDDPLVSHDDCYDWPELVKNPFLVAVRTWRAVRTSTTAMLGLLDARRGDVLETRRRDFDGRISP